MKKTFCSAFALIMIALFTVAPTSPATAYPGGISFYIAGKVGQKAVGSTVFFGAENLTQAPQHATTYRTPNACLWLEAVNKDGEFHPLEPQISGWRQCAGPPYATYGKDFQIPASGSLAGQIPLPDLPAGKYYMGFGAWPSPTLGVSSLILSFPFTIGTDGTFTEFGTDCDGIEDGALCLPIRLPSSLLG